MRDFRGWLNQKGLWVTDYPKAKDPKTAIAHRLTTIELRQIFTSPADYANPIEPSAVGSDKVSDAILHVVKTHDFNQPKAIVYGG